MNKDLFHAETEFTVNSEAVSSAECKRERMYILIYGHKTNMTWTLACGWLKHSPAWLAWMEKKVLCVSEKWRNGRKMSGVSFLISELDMDTNIKCWLVEKVWMFKWWSESMLLVKDERKIMV